MQRSTVVSTRRHAHESLTPTPRRIVSATAETRNHITPAILRRGQHSKLSISQ